MNARFAASTTSAGSGPIPMRPPAPAPDMMPYNHGQQHPGMDPGFGWSTLLLALTTTFWYQF